MEVLYNGPRGSSDRDLCPFFSAHPLFEGPQVVDEELEIKLN